MIEITPERFVFLEPRFWARVDKEINAPCWTWTTTLRRGYGIFVVGYRKGQPISEYAHRFAYRLLRGPIPDGMHSDHLCRNHACCNPDHIEIVTPRVNSLRGQAPPVLAYLAGVCFKGHPMTPENTYIRPGGGSRCRTCKRANDRRWYQIGPGAARAPGVGRTGGCGR